MFSMIYIKKKKSLPPVFTPDPGYKAGFINTRQVLNLKRTVGIKEDCFMSLTRILRADELSRPGFKCD